MRSNNSRRSLRERKALKGHTSAGAGLQTPALRSSTIQTLLLASWCERWRRTG
jgi:hypothetical protein